MRKVERDDIVSMENWVRGKTIGRGSFATVNLAIPVNNINNEIEGIRSRKRRRMAVKTATRDTPADSISMLENEKSVLLELQSCPEIITCYGGNQTVENGVVCHNLILEYAEQGSLANKLKSRPNCRFSSGEVKRYARSILNGLSFMHEKGFAHCDVKLDNMLLFGDGEVKIADFGLARRMVGEESTDQSGFMGTPMYMAPEVMMEGVTGSAAADVWGLGCAVVEMASGRAVWECEELWGLIRLMERGPMIPAAELGDQGRDFVEKCFIRNPNERWTVKMLLDHPFVVAGDAVSPRCPFEFPESSEVGSPVDWQVETRWVNSPVVEECLGNTAVYMWWEEGDQKLDLEPGLERIAELAGTLMSNWMDSRQWITVR